MNNDFVVTVLNRADNSNIPKTSQNKKLIFILLIFKTMPDHLGSDQRKVKPKDDKDEEKPIQGEKILEIKKKSPFSGNCLLIL